MSLSYRNWLPRTCMGTFFLTCRSSLMADVQIGFWSMWHACYSFEKISRVWIFGEIFFLRKARLHYLFMSTYLCIWSSILNWEICAWVYVCFFVFSGLWVAFFTLRTLLVLDIKFFLPNNIYLIWTTPKFSLVYNLSAFSTMKWWKLDHLLLSLSLGKLFHWSLSFLSLSLSVLWGFYFVIHTSTFQSIKLITTKWGVVEVIQGCFVCHVIISPEFSPTLNER